MFNISDFLEKFKKFDQKNNSRLEKILSVIKNVVGVEVSKKNLDLTNGILHIKASPALKQEIFLKKEAILASLSDERITDIR